MAVAEPKPPSITRVQVRKLPRCGHPHPKHPQWGCMCDPDHTGPHKLWRWESDNKSWQVFLENFPNE